MLLKHLDSPCKGGVGSGPRQEQVFLNMRTVKSHSKNNRMHSLAAIQTIRHTSSHQETCDMSLVSVLSACPRLSVFRNASFCSATDRPVVMQLYPAPQSSSQAFWQINIQAGLKLPRSADSQPAAKLPCQRFTASFRSWHRLNLQSSAGSPKQAAAPRTGSPCHGAWQTRRAAPDHPSISKQCLVRAAIGDRREMMRCVTCGESVLRISQGLLSSNCLLVQDLRLK